jgi:hypothetical protein
MTNKTKTIVALVGIGVVAYYLWMKKKGGSSMLKMNNTSSFVGDENFFNPFSGDEGFFNFTSADCPCLKGKEFFCKKYPENAECVACNKYCQSLASVKK